MSIKILCTKIPRAICQKQFVSRNRFAQYNNILTNTVSNMKGFIVSESYYPYNPNKNYNMVMSISEWNSYVDWENWYESDERNMIKEDFKDILENEKVSLLRKGDDVFLL